MKIQGPCSIIIKNFKMVVAEYLAKHGALLWPCVLTLVTHHEAWSGHCPGQRSLCVSLALSDITSDVRGLFPRELAGPWALAPRTCFHIIELVLIALDIWCCLTGTLLRLGGAHIPGAGSKRGEEEKLGTLRAFPSGGVTSDKQLRSSPSLWSVRKYLQITYLKRS